MNRPTVHTVHLHGFWDSPGNEQCMFICPSCGNLLRAQRPPSQPPAGCTHFFQACLYCGVATSLTIQGYRPNPTGEAPAPSVPEALQRAAAAPPATKPEPAPPPPAERQRPTQYNDLRGWRKRGDLTETFIGGLKAHAVADLFFRVFEREPLAMNEGAKPRDYLYLLDELEEMEAWLKTRFDH